jgi:hypothetical protein
LHLCRCSDYATTLIPLAVGAFFGNAMKKKAKKVKAVSGYKTKTGKKVGAYLKKAK